VFWNYWSETQDILHRVAAAAGATCILTDMGDQIIRFRSQTLRQDWRNFGLGQFEMSASYILVFVKQ